MLPIAPLTLPADLVGQPNGRLLMSLLVDVGPSGMLHHTAARAWRALVSAAAEQGLPLTYTYGGTYRTYSQQEALFVSRYAIGGTGGGCKTWNGARWCKKSSNLATAATPGTSNHGLGLAIDTAFDSDVSDGIGPDDAAGITGHPKWPWFLANAQRYGFSWELQSEPWHIRYVTGDNIPAAVVDFENPPIQPPKPRKRVAMFRIRFRDASYPPNAYTGLICNGPQLGWIGDGHGDVALGKGGAEIVDDMTGNELDGLIATCQTTTPPPPEFSAARQAAWTARRG